MDIYGAPEQRISSQLLAAESIRRLYALRNDTRDGAMARASLRRWARYLRELRAVDCI